MSARSMGRVSQCAAMLGVLIAAAPGVQAAAASDPMYPTMAPVAQYLIANRAEEVDLAKSAAPQSIADHADVLVLGAHGYEPAVKGTNGFVCFVGRSWDLNFANSEFWNQKIRTPQCDNAVASRSVLQRYLTRTARVLSGISKAEIEKMEASELTSGQLKAPEPGGVSYMMSKRGYIADTTGGPWHPHVMFFAPRTDAATWGANLSGSPMAADSTSYPQTTIFFVIVPNWSDGTAMAEPTEHK